MTIEELRRSNNEQILHLAADYGVRNVRIFGSVARGDSSSSSDIGGFLTGLQEILHGPVDIATERMLRPKVRDRALREAVLL